MMTKLFALPFLFLPLAASAATLTLPFDMGDIPSGTSPNGDSVTRTGISLFDASDPTFSQTLTAATGYYISQNQPAPTLGIGSVLDGEFSVRRSEAWLPQSNEGRYFGGTLNEVRYLSEGADDLRWFMMYSFVPVSNGGPSYFRYGAGFQDDSPFFYREDDDSAYRGIADDDRAYYDSYPGIATLTDPGEYRYDLAMVLASVVPDGSGGFSSITFREGVRISADVTLAPVPEPASMAVLGLGLAAFRRRRKA